MSKNKVKIIEVDLEKLWELKPTMKACDTLKLLLKAYEKSSELLEKALALVNFSEAKVDIESQYSSLNEKLVEAMATVMAYYTGSESVDDLAYIAKAHSPLSEELIESAVDVLKSIIKTVIVLRDGYETCVLMSMHELKHD